jgi:transmembrane sensor
MSNVYSFDERKTMEAEARRWLVKLDGDDEPGAKDIAELREWVARSPLHRQELLRISAFWDDANILTELSIPLHSKAQTRSEPSPGWLARLLRPAPALQLAGVVAVVCLLAVTLVPWLQTQSITATNGIYASAIGELRDQVLADGSVVTINTDSQIEVDYSDAVRKVRLLRGEAHFAVASDPDWPFEVYAGNGLVTAVGTAFSVYLDDNEVTVTVSEGRVDLAAAVEPGGAVISGSGGAKIMAHKKIASLGIGQSAVFHNRVIIADLAGSHAVDSDLLPEITTLTEQQLSRKLSWREGYLVFSGDPLGDVIDQVNRYMPTTIEIVDPGLSEIRIGGRFKVGELEAMLEVLESSFDIQVSRLSDQYIQLRYAP